MLYREIIAVCSQIHTKHVNTAAWPECGVCEKLNLFRVIRKMWLCEGRFRWNVYCILCKKKSPNSPCFKTVPIVSDAVLILKTFVLFLTAIRTDTEQMETLFSRIMFSFG